MPKALIRVETFPEWQSAWDRALCYPEAIGLLHALDDIRGDNTEPVLMQDEFSYDDRNIRVSFVAETIRDSFERLPIDAHPDWKAHSLWEPESQIKRLALRYAIRLCNIGLECNRNRARFLGQDIRSALFSILTDERVYLDEKVFLQPLARDIEIFLSRYYKWYMEGSRKTDIHDSFFQVTVLSGNAQLFESIPHGHCNAGYLDDPLNLRKHQETQVAFLGAWIDAKAEDVEARSDIIVRLLREGNQTIEWKNANQYVRIQEVLRKR